MGLASGLRQWWSDRQAERDFYALSADERAALARDIGVSEQTLGHFIACGSEAGMELHRLLQALSLDPAQVKRQHATLLRSMSMTCATCAAVRECRRDLDAGCASRTFSSYCPNAREINALDQERWQNREMLISRAGRRRTPESLAKAAL
jgi:hypothetical protein